MSVIERIPDPANFAHTYPPLFNYSGHYPHRGRDMKTNIPQNNVQHSPSPHGAGNGVFNPTFDVYDNGATYELHADLPGVDQNDIHIDFTEDNSLRVSGHKKQRQASEVNEDASDDAAISSEEESWLGMVNNIDAATTGPSPGARRTSVLDAQTYETPRENIDQWTAGRPKTNDTGRRSSITNAQARLQPAESIDAFSHHRTLSSQRREGRRTSIMNAATWEMPAENIDGATSAPRVKPAPAAQKFNFPRAVPEDNIDASTIGKARNTNIVVGPRPRSRRQSKQQNQPFLVSERSAGAFERTFRFPSPVVKDGVRVSLKDGVLTVLVTKNRPAGKTDRSKGGASLL